MSRTDISQKENRDREEEGGRERGGCGGEEGEYDGHEGRQT